jgi:hypothetical protein
MLLTAHLYYGSMQSVAQWYANNLEIGISPMLSQGEGKITSPLPTTFCY